MRFWEFADIGPQVDQPEDFRSALQKAIKGPTSQAKKYLHNIYHRRDGQAATRAAVWLRQIEKQFSFLYQATTSFLHPESTSKRTVQTGEVLGFRREETINHLLAKGFIRAYVKPPEFEIEKRGGGWKTVSYEGTEIFHTQNRLNEYLKSYEIYNT
jgi:hypothetical protein